jgi:hypothetical protein
MKAEKENGQMSDETTKIPEGYMQNGLGHLVPLANVPELDKLRDETVRAMVREAETVGRLVAEFRTRAGQAVASFCELSAQEFGAELGGGKGNVTLTSYDGSMKVVRARADQITFNEAVRVTRELCFKCIAKWSEGANANLATVVRRSFETDKNGHLSAAKILSLRTYEIRDDPDWDAAMDALDRAIQVIGSRQYVRFYRRGPDGKYAQVGVDCGKGGE